MDVRVGVGERWCQRIEAPEMGDRRNLIGAGPAARDSGRTNKHQTQFAVPIVPHN